MNDAKYVFIQDVKDKKLTARGSHNRRAHAGKGGAVKFPSDYLSKKELKAMSGEIKTYKLNQPISWAEFKAMPEDLQRRYLKSLRDRFNVSFSKIGKMLGVSRVEMSHISQHLGIAQGFAGNISNFDCEGWEEFINGGKPINAVLDDKTSIVEEKEAENTPEMPKIEPVAANEFKAAIPLYGSMNFSGNATEALKTMIAILGGAAVDITVSWQQPIAPLYATEEIYRGAAKNG